MADAKPQDYANRQAWRPRPWLSRAIRLLVFLLPVIGALVATTILGRVISQRGWPLAARIGWMVAMFFVAAVVSNVVAKRTERALPLSALCQMNLAFPEEAPSRVGLALRMGSAGRSEKILEEFDRQGLSSDPQAAALQTIELINALNRHDRKTRGHAEKVRALSDVIAEQLDLPEHDRNLLRWASLLHDVGKISVPAHILNKEGKPSEEEWATLKTHPGEGTWRIAPLRPWLGEWADCVDGHHERFDGSGYPRGLAGYQIALSARIVAIADSFEVMTAARSYKKPMTYEDARAELVRCSGTHFDPVIVRAFLAVGRKRTRVATGLFSSWLSQLASGNGPVSIIVQSVTGGVTASGGASILAPLVRGLQIAAAPDHGIGQSTTSRVLTAASPVAARAARTTVRAKAAAIVTTTVVLSGGSNAAPKPITPTIRPAPLEWSMPAHQVPDELAFAAPVELRRLDDGSLTAVTSSPVVLAGPATTEPFFAVPAPIGGATVPPAAVAPGPVSAPTVTFSSTTTTSRSTTAPTSRSTTTTTTTIASSVVAPATPVAAPGTTTTTVASASVSTTTTVVGPPGSMTTTSGVAPTTMTSTTPSASSTAAPTTAATTTTTVTTTTTLPTTTPSPSTTTTAPTTTTTTTATTTTALAPTPTVPVINGPGCSVGEWSYDAFANLTLTGPTVATGCETTISHDWALAAPFPSVPADGFSVVWEADLLFPGGDVSFVMRSDDGIRLYLDDVRIFDLWIDHTVRVDRVARTVSAGAHTVRFEYFDRLDQATAALRVDVGVDPTATTLPPPTTTTTAAPPTTIPTALIRTLSMPATGDAIDGVAVDNAGNTYMLTSALQRVFKRTAAGVITTFAGTGTNGFSGDGSLATLAMLNNPSGIAVSSAGELYIADGGNRRIRKVSTAGIITTVAGTGLSGSGGDGGSPTAATFKELAGLALRPDDRLLVADRGARVVREINFSTNRITTVLGNGTPNGGGDGSPATATGLSRPVDVSAYDTVFAIADDRTGKVWEVTADGVAHLVAGGGSQTVAGAFASSFGFTSLSAVAVVQDGTSGGTHDVYVLDKGTSRLWRLDRSSGRVLAYAGTGIAGNANPVGLASVAQLNQPRDVISLLGFVYLADTGNDALRLITL